MTVPRSGFHAAALGLALALAVVAAATRSHAADIGHCDTPESMTALLKAEGQRSLASGNQQVHGERLADGTLRAANKMLGLIFTADPDGKVGYVLQASQPIGTRPEKLCVAERMHAIRLYDVRKPGLAPETLLKTTAEDAARRCDQMAKQRTIARGACGFHNSVMQKSEAVGERIMMLGQGVQKQPDGSWQPDGTLITITANMTGDGTMRDGRGAIQYTMLPEGATIIASVFIGTAYTETARQILASRP